MVIKKIYLGEPSLHYKKVMKRLKKEKTFADSILQFLASFFRTTPTLLGYAIRRTIYKFAFKRCGKRFTLHPFSIIKHPQRMVIGKDCIINPFCFINALQKVKFGNDVTLSAHCVIVSHVIQNERMRDLGYPTKIKPQKLEPIEIDDHTWIAAGCLIGPGVKIGKNCQIGANSVVLNDIPDNCFAAGSPAKIISRIKNKKLN